MCHIYHDNLLNQLKAYRVQRPRVSASDATLHSNGNQKPWNRKSIAYYLSLALFAKRGGGPTDRGLGMGLAGRKGFFRLDVAGTKLWQNLECATNSINERNYANIGSLGIFMSFHHEVDVGPILNFHRIVSDQTLFL